MSSNKNKKALKSGTHLKIMLFFRDNQGSIDTARGISTWTNENIHQVRKALEELVKSGLLKADRTPSTVGYSCALTQKELSSLVAEFTTS